MQASSSSHLHANPVERISDDAVLWLLWEVQSEAGMVRVACRKHTTDDEWVDRLRRARVEP